jgi:ribosome-binding factor A
MKKRGFQVAGIPGGELAGMRSQGAFKRTDRVGDLMRGEIADLLLRRVKDPRIGFVTVTGVVVSPDLRHATVFISVLEEGARAAEALDALSRAAGFIRAELGRRMRLKYTPELVFKRDDTTGRAVRIEAIMDELHDTKDATGGEPDGDDHRG